MHVVTLADHGSDPLAIREYDGWLLAKVLLCHARNDH